MTRLLSIFAITVAATLAACATSEEEGEAAAERLRGQALVNSDPRIVEQESRVCFTRSVSGFRDYENGRGLILRRSARNEYLVTFNRACFTLKNAQRIGFDERFGGGCLGRGDGIYISDELFPSSSSPFSTDLCRVDEIFRWDEDAAVEDDDATEENEE